MVTKTESPLELLVRPNQTGIIRPQPWNTPSTRADEATKNDMVLLSWGGSGDSIFSIARPDFAWKVEDEKDETERTYDVVRIKNKDDPEQYVDTEVMTEYKARNKIDQSRVTLRFGATQASENTEIISRGNKRSS